jgi:hypothetical protein
VTALRREFVLQARAVVVPAVVVVLELGDVDLGHRLRDLRRERLRLLRPPLGDVLVQPRLVAVAADDGGEREVVGEVLRVGLGIVTHWTTVRHCRNETAPRAKALRHGTTDALATGRKSSTTTQDA